MPFTIPNLADAAATAIAAPDSEDFDIIVSGFAQTGVESGLAATVAGTDMNVSLSAGSVRIANGIYSIAAGTATIGAANATLARFDLICATTGGTVAVTAGVAAANPVFPAVPATSVALYAVYVPAASTTVVSGRVIDKRVVIADDGDWLAYSFF